MSGLSASDLWKERLTIYEVLNQWNNYVPLALSPIPEDVRPSLELVRSELEDLLATLPETIRDWLRAHWDECISSYGPRREAFMDFFRRGLKHGPRTLDISAAWDEWTSSHEPIRYDEFVMLLQRRLEEIDTSLALIPSGPEKAVTALRAYVEWGVRESGQIYDSMVLLGDGIPHHTIEQEVAAWKAELRQYKKDHEDDPLGVDSAIFWSSGDGNEIIDAVSRYCLMEQFQIGEFPETETEIEYLVGSELLTGLSGMESHFAALNGDRYFGKSTLALYLASRSRKLCNRIRHFVEIALVRVARQQFMDGWYTDYTNTMESAGRRVAAPSVYLTALSAVCLLRLGRQQYQREHAEKAVKWLVQQQRTDGSWVMIEDGQKRKPDLMTTVLALEAVRLAGVPGMEHTLALGERWLLSSQRPTGEWADNDRWPPFPFETVLVLEYLDKARVMPRKSLPSLYLRLAKGFLSRATEFALEDDPNAWRLSLVTGYQALEAFLYGLLEHPSVNMQIFKQPNQTIGGRDALKTLEEHLRNTGRLPQGGKVAFRPAMERLNHLRDEIVHKAAGVPKDDCREILESLTMFVDQYSSIILGYPLNRT